MEVMAGMKTESGILIQELLKGLGVLLRIINQAGIEDDAIFGIDSLYDDYICHECWGDGYVHGATDEPADIHDCVNCGGEGWIVDPEKRKRS